MPRSKPAAPAAPVAVVTGAARGIGMAVAEWFLANGYRVALLDIDRKELDRTGKAPRRCRARAGDPLRRFGCEAGGERRAPGEAGPRRIDALVNNAGVAVFKPILETTLAEWQHVISTNLTGAFICSQACAP
jgi:NAD(P)-dependent dehydrogenase (short-subunit alcohol dehydrogenase family)